MSSKMRARSSILCLAVASTASPVFAVLNLTDPSIINLYKFNEQTSGQIDNSLIGSFLDTAVTGTPQDHDNFIDDPSDGPAWTTGAAYNSVSGIVGDGIGLSFSRSDNDRTRIAPWYEVPQGNYTNGKSFSIMLRVNPAQLNDNTNYDLFGFGSTAIKLAGVSGGGLGRLDVQIRDGGVGGNGAENFWFADSLTNTGPFFKVAANAWTNLFVIYDANVGITLASDDGTTFIANSNTTVPSGFDTLTEGFSDADRRWLIGSLTTAGGSYDGLIESIAIWDKALTPSEADAVGFANSVFPGDAPAWGISGSGDWNIASNWSNGVVPDGVGAEARLYGAINSPRTVYTDAAITLGALRFNNPNTYVLTGSGSLTLQNTGSNSAVVEVQQGTHKLSLPITIASDTTFSVASGATLKISNPMTINSGKSVSQAGLGSVVYESTITVQTAASIAFGNSTHAHSLALQGVSNASINTHLGGGPNVLQLDSLSIDAGSTLDLKNNKLLVNSTSAAIRSSIIGGSIFSSSATPNQNLGYADVAGGQVAVLYTLLGDANLDLQVTSADFTALALSFNNPSGADWAEGDFNYDGIVNALDFNAIATNFGGTLTSPTALGSVVPEPASLGVIVLAVGTLLRRRSKC